MQSLTMQIQPGRSAKPLQQAWYYLQATAKHLWNLYVLILFHLFFISFFFMKEEGGQTYLISRLYHVEKLFLEMLMVIVNCSLTQ